MAVILGLDAKLWIDTNGESSTWATPTWTEAKMVKGLTLTMNKALTDVSTRGTGGYRQQRGTLKEAQLEFDFLYDPTDSIFDHLRTQYFANAKVLASAMDGEIAAANITTGTTRYGLKAWWDITDFSIDEQLEEAMNVNVTMVLADSSSTETPTWMSVAGSG